MNSYYRAELEVGREEIRQRPVVIRVRAPLVQYLVETGQVLANQQDYNHEKREWDNFRLVPSNQVPRGYNYNMKAENNTRSGVDPSRLPCSTMVGGQCADR